MAEGKEVREAYDGPEVEHDQLISEINRMIHSEGERSSDASESAAETKKFLDDTGLNNTAVGWGKTIVKKLSKKNGQQKAMDITRSLKVILPMIENHVGGQGTVEMDLEGPQEDDGQAEATEPVPEPDDPETAEFNAEVDETMGDGDVVTPIDFGGGDAA